MRKAFICGVSGQDGIYLAQLLLGKGYEVYKNRRNKKKQGQVLQSSMASL